MDRLQQLRRRLDPGMEIIELGPSFNPLVPKREGWRTTVVDHAPRAALAEKYAAHGLDLSRLEDVDVVWSGGDLAAAFPPHRLGQFDAMVISHVIEHMPDPISFLESAQRLLKPNGIVVLAVPDKRYCFDFFEPMTTTGDWLSAHQIKPQAHPKRVAFNHMAYAASNGGRIAWEHGTVTDLRLVHTLQEAAAHFASADDSGRGHYVDYHAWRFTPSSFRLIVLESALLCDLDLHVAECSNTVGTEFFAVLERGRPDPGDEVRLTAQRLALLRATMAELRQQTDTLIEPAPPTPAPAPRSLPRRALGRLRRVLRAG